MHDIGDLDSDFTGVTSIIQTWFSNYKGRGVLEAGGFEDARSANEILERAEKTPTRH